MSQIPQSGPVPTPAPWYQGSSGATVHQRSEVQKFARTLLESQDYRDSLARRIKSDSLSAAVETMLWYYAYGKPVEHVVVTPGQVDLSTLSIDDLQKMAKTLTEQLEEAKALNDAIPAQFKKVA